MRFFRASIHERYAPQLVDLLKHTEEHFFVKLPKCGEFYVHAVFKFKKDEDDIKLQHEGLPGGKLTAISEILYLQYLSELKTF